MPKDEIDPCQSLSDPSVDEWKNGEVELQEKLMRLTLYSAAVQSCYVRWMCCGHQRAYLPFFRQIVRFFRK